MPYRQINHMVSWQNDPLPFPVPLPSQLLPSLLKQGAPPCTSTSPSKFRLSRISLAALYLQFLSLSTLLSLTTLCSASCSPCRLIRLYTLPRVARRNSCLPRAPFPALFPALHAHAVRYGHFAAHQDLSCSVEEVDDRGFLREVVPYHCGRAPGKRMVRKS